MQSSLDVTNSPLAPESVRSDRAFKIGTVIVLAALYLLYINRFSFDLDGELVFSLSDDQMISMRYADNLASGNGLVWNPGERVEGFTNPLWTAYMAIWHVAQVPRTKTSLAIMLTSALILILNALAVYSIASRLSPHSPIVARVAMLLTGTYWSLVDWSLAGFEVGLTALLTSVVVLQSFIYMESRRTRHLVAIAVCLIALGWTRLEMLPIAGVPVAYLFLVNAGRARVLSVVVVPVVASVAVLFATRHWYYGEWLPNTYYLKLTGIAMRDRVTMGLNKTFTTLLTHFSLLLVPMALLVPGSRRDHRIWILMAIFATGVLYTIYIGGDTWERPYHANRFLSATTPLLFVVTLHVMYERMERLRRDPRAASLLLAVVGILMAVGLGGRSFNDWLKFPVENYGLFKMVKLGVELREGAPLDSRVAVVWAGALPYFSRLYSIDLLGKSDKVIARSKPHNMATGHNKWNYEHSVGVLKPDYIVELWHPTQADIAYISRLGYSQKPGGIYIRNRPAHEVASH